MRDTLVDFGFPQTITNLTMHCITASSISLLWNGNSLESFNLNKGLRQGGLLSHYLFVLCMENLTLLISEKVQDGDQLLVKVSRNDPSISHPFSADDCLIFTRAKASQVQLVNMVLDSFCTASGMKVNLEKSKFLALAMCPGSNAVSLPELLQLSGLQTSGSIWASLQFQEH